jgi:Tfp pilus assembly protein PilF
MVFLLKRSGYMRKKILYSLTFLPLCVLFCMPASVRAESAQDAALQQAMRHAKDGNYGLAVEELQQIIRQQPDDPRPHTSLGLVYFKTRELDNALAEFSKVTAIRANSPMAFYFMAQIYEGKAVSETDAAATRQLKQKALDAWQSYLATSGTTPRPERHRNIGISMDEAVARAKKHIVILQEDLRNE